MSSTKLLCASAEQNVSCRGCTIAGLEGARLRADIAEVGGMVLDRLHVMLGADKPEISGQDLYRAFGQVLENDIAVIDPNDAEHALTAANRAYTDASCTRRA